MIKIATEILLLESMKAQSLAIYLDRLSKMLASIKYECNTSVYTLEDDEMGVVFQVRDELDLMANRIKDLYEISPDKR